MFISSGFIFKIRYSFYWTFTEIGRSFLKTTLADQFQEVAFLKHSENLHFSEPINDQCSFHTETSANQLTGFYIIKKLVVQGLR